MVDRWAGELAWERAVIRHGMDVGGACLHALRNRVVTREEDKIPTRTSPRGNATTEASFTGA